MTPIYLGQYDSGSDEWHDKRATRVGGSEAAAILGLSPYESRFSLYHRKIGLAPRQPENTAMSWGKRLERVVIEKWLETHADSHMAIKVNGSYLSAAHPFMIANPDQMVLNVAAGETSEVLEVKTSPYGDAWGPTGSDIYPVGYLVQCLHYGHVMEADTIHLAVLISGYDYREYTIHMADHADDLKLIIDAETEFIDDLTNRRAPDIDAHSQTYEVVKQLHPDIDPEREIELDGLGATYLDALAAYKEADAAKRQASAQIIDRMDGAKYATYQGERIARRQAKGDAAPHLVAVTRPAAKKGIAA